MELKEGTGPITGMCPCGHFLEIYKVDTTFRIQTPESIDPDQTNPNAPWVASPVATVGSGSLAVSRVLLQSREMLDAAVFDGQLNKEALVLHLHGCKEALVGCEGLASKVKSEIDDIVEQITGTGISRDNRGRGLNPFPQVPDLDLDCGSFLVRLNRAIKLTCELPAQFLQLERLDSNFDHLGSRLAELLGVESPITKFVQSNAPGIRHLIHLRNFHEHPRKTKTIIENFRVLANGQIQAPVWYLAGEEPTQPTPIANELLAALGFVRDIAEALFIHLLMHRISKNFPYVIEQIPEASIDPARPIRYRLSIDFAKIRVTKSDGDA